MSQIRRNISFLLAFLAFMGAVLISTPVILLAGPSAEPRFFPVVTDVRLISVVRDRHSVIFDVAGDKARQCTYLGASALAGPREGLMESALLTFPESLGTDRTRPVGVQSFGTWRIEPVMRGELVAIQLRHRCHGLWDTTTQLGPWRVPAP